MPATERIVACVEAAATQTFDAALAQARELFEQCRTSTESASLRHLFFAERGAGSSFGTPRTVSCVGVIGSGTMGTGIALAFLAAGFSGIAIAFAQSGFSVILVDTNPSALQAGVDRLCATIDGTAKKGRITREQADAAKARVRSATDLAELREADLVVEAVFENMAVKQELFAHMGELCKPGAVLATNTSTLDVDAIAMASGRPADVVGLHFFSPAHIMRLVEIVRARASSEAALATALAVTKRIGKIGVVVGNCFGFVGNRMLYAYGREKEMMLLEGATPEQIDGALEAFGMAMGPNSSGRRSCSAYQRARSAKASFLASTNRCTCSALP